MNNSIVGGLILLAGIFMVTHGLSVLKNTAGHDIMDGNCSKTTYEDRVYYDHVNKMGFPLIVRTESVDYNGNKSIYCIQALNQKNNQTGGSAIITSGGVGQKFVTIELESFRGHGLEYYVIIFAHSNSTNITNHVIPPMVENWLNQN